MLDHPFLAGAIARLPLRLARPEETWCATAATDGYHIVVNKAFLASLTEDETCFVLAHELLHCVFGHADRRHDRTVVTWNCATDYAINQILVDVGMNMPRIGLYSPSFRGMAAETIYGLLQGKAGLGAPVSHPAPGSGQGLGDSARIIHDQLSADQRDEQVPRGGWCQQVEPGSHAGSRLDPGELPTELERQRIRQGLAASLRGQLHGRVGAMAEEEIRAGARPAITWEDLLSRFVTGIRRSDYRMYPFNKKHIHRGLYLPSVGAPGPQRLIVALDTSGSISGELAGQLVSEVDSLRSATECGLTLIQCDAVVTSVREFDAWEPSVLAGDGSFVMTGRGGTDFRPVFEWIEKDVEEALEPDAVIYLTDGYGTFPMLEPRWPVVWVVPPSGLDDARFPWGSVIRVPAA